MANVKRCRVEATTFRAAPRQVRYHHTGDSDDDTSTIASMPGFATPMLCNELVDLCESVGFGKEQDAARYTQATVDLEVDAAPRVQSFLRTRGLVHAVASCMLRTHGHVPAAFDDVFVVKYDTQQQRELERHVDAGEVSFMLALSPRASYAGGGTEFDVLAGGPLHLEQGELVLFDASLYHKGVPIVAGTRYLLVGFCFVGTAATRVPGNVGLGLSQLRGTSSSRFDLWQLTGSHSAERLHEHGFVAHARALYARQSTHAEAPASSWVGSTEDTQAGTLAAFAQDVFWFHARRLGMTCAADGGAEYWVQCVATAVVSRHADERDGSDGHGSHGGSGDETETIPWHYDKDEAAFAQTGVWRHPAVATVTYLTTGGVPTVVFGESGALISHPHGGNHLAFAGDLLHGCPAHATGLCAANTTCAEQGPRTTLLVNLWPGRPPLRTTFLPRGGAGVDRAPKKRAAAAAAPKKKREREKARTKDAVGKPKAVDQASSNPRSKLTATIARWQEVCVQHPTRTDAMEDPDAVLQQVSRHHGRLAVDGHGRDDGLVQMQQPMAFLLVQ